MRVGHPECLPGRQIACQATILHACQACQAAKMLAGQPECLPGSQNACWAARMPACWAVRMCARQLARRAARMLAGQPEFLWGGQNACWALASGPPMASCREARMRAGPWQWPANGMAMAWQWPGSLAVAGQVSWRKPRSSWAPRVHCKIYL